MGKLPVFFPPDGGLQFASGSYVGTGAAGTANKNVLELPFNIELLAISGGTSGYWFVVTRGVTNIRSLGPYGSNVYFDWPSDGTVEWHSDSSTCQLNEIDRIYHWVAIGW